jgi:hypothetical protein
MQVLGNTKSKSTLQHFQLFTNAANFQPCE